MASVFLPFVQFELTRALGPDPGRYVVAGPDAAAEALEPDRVTGVVRATSSADVLQIQLRGAPPPRGGLIFRRPRPALPDEEPREVALMLATWIQATRPLEGHGQARPYLEAAKTQQERQEDLIQAALDVVNVAVRAHRAAARDPFLPELGRDDPREIRIGFGTAEQLAAGGWEEAFAPARSRSAHVPRAERLRPTHVVALALGGSLPVLEAEDMALRVMLDLEQGRLRSAALQLRACAELLMAELLPASADPVIAERRELVADAARDIDRLAAAAAEDRLGVGAAMEIEERLGALEDVLEAWRADATRVEDDGATDPASAPYGEWAR